jgi:hypothetical protein
MTTLEQAARHALDALENNMLMQATKILQKALEQPADAPVAYHGWILRDVLFDSGEPVGHRAPQPTREWVGLTDEERRSICNRFENDNGHIQAGVSFARTVEQILRGKNV